ncbi:hypothetical protein OIU78_017646 [Salix suchowensis]|nr:hypothetical protein OIU78_017646 [Salix suchowensis]
MGNCCSISIPCDRLFSGSLDFISRKASYISKLEENVDRLRTAVEDLGDLHSTVTGRVQDEERQQRKPLAQVQRWISRAEDAISKYKELLRDGPQEIEKLCLRGYCSKSYKSSYRFAKKVDEGLRVVADLKAKGVFEIVTEKIPAGSGVQRPSEPAVGLDSTFNEVWTCLREEEEVGIIGLYGMGGVGKTTLLTQINNESLKTPNDFEIVIWVVVSRDMRTSTVQESIRREIGFPDDIWNNKSPPERATVILRITELPTELKALVKLRCLNLEYTDSLSLLPDEVISCFSMMRILRMFRCGSSEPGVHCILSRDESLVDELLCLEELNVLTLTIRSAAALERLSSSLRMQNTNRVLHLELFHD